MSNIDIFLSLENSCTFLLLKEKTWKCIFKTNIGLPQNRTEKQIMPSKTTINRLFSDIWCYLFIAYFDWKIGVFQPTVVTVYYILKYVLKDNHLLLLPMAMEGHKKVVLELQNQCLFS